jgi:hypothetical protein
VAATGYFPRQLAVAAAQVKEMCREWHRIQDAAHTRLKALARGRKLEAKGLVKLAIKRQQSRDSFRTHAAII